METILVLAGGCSDERTVSLASGAAVAGALRAAGFAVEVMDPAAAGFARDICCRAPRVAAVFIALHGRGGEDGTMQGFLETLGLPYTGSGVAASALAFDKVRAKIFFGRAGLSVPPFSPRRRLPLVVKPVRGGSTLGVSLVREPGELPAALARARACGSGVFLERYIAGTELAIGVLGDSPPQVLPPIEIVPAGGFYDYEAKYVPGGSRHFIPARLDPAAARAAAALVLRAHCLLGCRGFSRGEVIVDRHGRPWLLEINTIPGFTGTSLFPEAAAAAGYSLPALVRRLVDQARAGRREAA